jgi:acyl-CoA reductase-like NAD-dependent aldehyde dehydrogenase
MSTLGATSGVAALDFNEFYNVLDGQLVKTKNTRQSLNPSTLEPNPEVPVSTIEDVDAAVRFARVAAAQWVKVPLTERQQAVLNFAQGLRAEKDGFAMLTREQGKPVSSFK